MKTKGIVIKTVKYNDNDIILTILTSNLGKISCIARGARRVKSPLLACSQYLVYSEFVLYEGTSMYHVNSSETINLFYKVRENYDKLIEVSKLTNLIGELVEENQESEKLLNLLLNTVFVLNKDGLDDIKIEKYITAFKLRLILLLGYMPYLNKCTICEEKIEKDKDSYIFSFNLNGIICSDECKQKEQEEYIPSIVIKAGTFNAMKYIMSADDKKIFDFEVSEKVQKELTELSDMYINVIVKG